MNSPPLLLIHGGAGNIIANKIPQNLTEQYSQSLQSILDHGKSLLQKNVDVVSVVSTVVSLLENDPLFNAGKGSVLNSEKEILMDAALMCGKTLKAGCLSNVSKIKNPIFLAKKILEKSPHVFLCSEGAESFAKDFSDIELASIDYFLTDLRVKQLESAQLKNDISLDYDKDETWDKKHGTVGAVALDTNGNIAAATSTGGLTNKKPGRVSDSCIIGAGTLADNKSIALSATGTGDVFIKARFASLVENHYLQTQNLQEALEIALNSVKELNGEGGAIAISRTGDYALNFNTKGMFRALWSKRDNIQEIAMFS